MTANSDDDRDWILDALDRFERALTLYASRILGDVERARDVVQEVFLRLCREPRDRVENVLRPWLFTVCRNLALDARRKERPMGTMSEERAAERVSPEPGPSATLEKKEALSRVLRGLEELPDKQREVIWLKFKHGLSYREISRVTEQSIGNVGFLIHVGLKALRGRFAAEAIPESAEGSTS